MLFYFSPLEAATAREGRFFPFALSVSKGGSAGDHWDGHSEVLEDD